MGMQIPGNDLEQIRYNASQLGGMHVGELSAYALAADLKSLMLRFDQMSTTVASIRAGMRRTVNTQTTLLRDKLDVQRVDIVAEVGAYMDQKLAEFVQQMQEHVQATNVSAHVSTDASSNASADTSADTSGVLSQASENSSAETPRVSPMTAHTPFTELKGAILNGNNLFQVSMAPQMRKLYDAYISTLRHNNGVDSHFLDASRMKRDEFRRARRYMPEAIQRSPLWRHV